MEEIQDPKQTDTRIADTISNKLFPVAAFATTQQKIVDIYKNNKDLEHSLLYKKKT